MSSLSLELRTLVRLSAPVALTQLGLMATGVVDTVMVSRLGVRELAASALANMWQWAWLSLGLGIVMGTEPLISQAHGRGDGTATGLALQRGVVLAVCASVPLCAAQAFTAQGLSWLGQEASTAELAARYNVLKLPTIPCFLIYSAMRQYLQGRTLMAPATWVMWLGNAFHVVGNWALIFGRLGMPALGLEGAAIASSLTTFLLVLALWGWIVGFRLHRGAWTPWGVESFAWSGLRQAFLLGAPIGAQMTLEAWAFSLATLMAGWIGIEAVGSYQVVLNMAAFAFMVPLGISQGASARVGNLVGARDRDGLPRAVWGSVGLGAAVMTVSALGFAVFRHELPRLYTSDTSVASLATSILPIAAAFQLFDGTQVVAGGVLRGMGRPHAAAVVNLLGYFAFALPLAYWLAFPLGYGLLGIWAALAVGLTVVAIALLYWVRKTVARPLSELSVELAVDASPSSS